MKKSILREMFGVREATHPKHAETELNMGQSVAQAPRKYTKSTGKAQSDIDSARSLVKKEAGGETTQGLRITGDQGTMEALIDALDFVANRYGTQNEDIADWAERSVEALHTGIRAGTASLPPYRETEGMEDFEDDTGPGPDADEEY